jgi:hypothetical protein
MNHHLVSGFFAILILCVSLSALPNDAFAQGAPIIAPEIGQLIAEQGVDAANARFAELIQSPDLDYNIENQGLMTLMSSYMQAGNNQAAEAVGQMYGKLMQQMMSGPSSAFPPGMMEEMQKADEAAKELQATEQAAEQEMQQKAQERSRGKSRDDLKRFAGLYSDPDSDKTNRTVFVTVSCDGYLVTGPMWADVGAWWMRSAADKVFTYADSWTNLSFEFVGDDGRGMMLKHDVEGVISPLENKAPLPDEWDDCEARPRR